MLKILNNDKFTTAQNRHSLVSLKIPILNTLPVRAKVWAHLLFITFALTGRRALFTGTQGVALGWGLAALSGRSRRGLRGLPLSRAAPHPPYYLLKNRTAFFKILNIHP